MPETSDRIVGGGSAADKACFYTVKQDHSGAMDHISRLEPDILIMLAQADRRLQRGGVPYRQVPAQLVTCSQRWRGHGRIRTPGQDGPLFRPGPVLALIAP